MQNIQNIIFDLGGVILNIDYLLTEKAFIELGFTDFPKLYSQLQQSNLFDLYETGKISTDYFIESIKQHQPNLKNEQIINAWNAMLLDLPLERLEYIKLLQQHFNVFLFSNTNELHEAAFNQEVKRVTQQESLDPFFDEVFLSHKIGFRKPNKDGFLHIINKQKLDIANTLFVDDSPQHIQGAQELGLQTLYLPKGKYLTEELPKLIGK